MIGVRPEDQKKGVECIILREGIKAIQSHGGIACQTGPMLEDNANVQNIWTHFEHFTNRRRRCWTYTVTPA